MSEHAYTYGEILISPYKFEKILKLKIIREVNEHAKLYLEGIICESDIDKYVETTDDSEVVNVSINKNGSVETLFQGIVTNISINADANVRTMKLEVLSLTVLMDITKRIQSFQDKGITYKNIFLNLSKGYKNSYISDEISKGKAIPGLIVQYKETDWEFCKRLASHFNSCLIPECTLGNIKLHVGTPNSAKSYDIKEFNYSVKKDLKEYRIKSQNYAKNLNEENLISYEIISYKILNLCSKVIFKNRNLYISRVETEMVRGVIQNKYVLKDIKAISTPKIMNNGITGVSLSGSILGVSKDRVKVRLDIDGGGSASGSTWFPYSTVYSSPDGSGWYCMPEVGDAIRLYFPDNEEKNAFATSSVNLKSGNSQKRSDPSVKSIGTKDGKEIVFNNGAVEIIGNGNMLMRLTDSGGIEIKSNKKIVLDAKQDIEINGGEKVIIQGKGGVDLKQSSTTLKIGDDVVITGSKVNIE